MEPLNSITSQVSKLEKNEIISLEKNGNVYLCKLSNSGKISSKKLLGSIYSDSGINSIKLPGKWIAIPIQKGKKTFNKFGDKNNHSQPEIVLKENLINDLPGINHKVKEKFSTDEKSLQILKELTLMDIGLENIKNTYTETRHFNSYKVVELNDGTKALFNKSNILRIVIPANSQKEIYIPL
ncbi:MAG: hypothetical protein ABII94_02635 [Patescibacteria group bacterium]